MGQNNIVCYRLSTQDPPEQSYPHRPSPGFPACSCPPTPPPPAFCPWACPQPAPRRTPPPRIPAADNRSDRRPGAPPARRAGRRTVAAIPGWATRRSSPWRGSRRPCPRRRARCPRGRRSCTGGSAVSRGSRRWNCCDSLRFRRGIEWCWKQG